MTIIDAVRRIGFVEAISAITLFFVAMPLKYLASNTQAVPIVGAIHGALWMAYLLVIALAFFKGKLDAKWSAILVVMSIIPFGPFVVDRKLATKTDSNHS